MEHTFASFPVSDSQGTSGLAGTSGAPASFSDSVGMDRLRGLHPPDTGKGVEGGRLHVDSEAPHDEEHPDAGNSATPVNNLSSTATSLRLFVSKLPNSCTPRRLREYFETLMEAKGVPHAMASSAILDVYIPAGPTGRLRNFSFVSFSERGFLELVLHSGPGPDGTHVLDGRRIYLDVAAPRGIRVHNGVVIGEGAPADPRVMQPMGSALPMQGYNGGGPGFHPGQGGPMGGGGPGLYGDPRQGQMPHMQQVPMQYGYPLDYGMPQYGFLGPAYYSGPPPPMHPPPAAGPGYGRPMQGQGYGGHQHGGRGRPQYGQGQMAASYGYAPQAMGRIMTGSPAVLSTSASQDGSSSQGATSGSGGGGQGTGTPTPGSDREAGQVGSAATVGLTGLAMSRPFDPRLPTLAVGGLQGQFTEGVANFHGGLHQGAAGGGRSGQW